MTETGGDSRFEPDPEELVDPDEVVGLPEGWVIDSPDPDSADVARLTTLLRDHEREGRGWPGAGREDVLVEVSGPGLRTRQNVVVRDGTGLIRAWGSVHDRAVGRMLLVHVVERGLPERVARACSDVVVEWAVGQAREVGSARGLEVQQIDTGAFADDERQHRWLAASGFERVRTWWQMSRPVTPEETALVPAAELWSDRGVTVRLVRRRDDGMPDEDDLRAVHDVLEEAFTDHFNSKPETFDEFLHRLREDPGHRWDHWWLASLDQADGPAQPVGALVATVSEATEGPDGSYVAYIGVIEAARGRGVAKGLLRTVIADAAARGRDRVGLEVDADSETGAHHLYRSLGWETSYVTESWHRDVAVPEPVSEPATP
ncbi:GNAT family N-acetyltransferase [Nocardioides sp.]|uniref:GNAT family N-acetyltransferase n=1 Tax=Nocardioides sp. TaxID=35761 RepID=UPI001A1A2387|nr:GNAT family N-acetyltransferase [Nocardioides sp.]MBJ7356955.1 GNAT family N-acetyltransferase [Nocardioides sp.]